MIRLYKFYSNNCLPCVRMDKLLKKTLSEIDKEMVSKIDFVEVDVDKDTKLATEYKIKTIPAIVITNTDTKEYHSMLGFYLIREVKNFIESKFKLLNTVQ